jgi:hypothetical protein
LRRSSMTLQGFCADTPSSSDEGPSSLSKFSVGLVPAASVVHLEMAYVTVIFLLLDYAIPW